MSTPTCSSTAIVTGATRGLGLETARALARDRSQLVVLAVRDTDAGARVAAQLGPNVTVRALDLASLESVRAFTVADLPPVRRVVANAGVQHREGTRVTADGYEATFGVNHLGHALLVDRLLDAGATADDARIAFVASGTHDPRFRRNGGFPAPAWPTDLAALARPGAEPGGAVRYASSKLANVLWARALAARVGREGRGAARVNAFDPGLMPGSGLARDYPRAARMVWERVMPALTVLPGINTVARSGQDLAALVTDPALGALHGAYVVGRRAQPPSALAQDDTEVARLVELTTALLATGAG